MQLSIHAYFVLRKCEPSADGPLQRNAVYAYVSTWHVRILSAWRALPNTPIQCTHSRYMLEHCTQWYMAAPKILRRFPLHLGIGTDICHVVRIHRILKSSRGTRFVQKILNTDERAHPKIQWLLGGQTQLAPTWLDANSHSPGPHPDARQPKAEEAHDHPTLSQDIQVAASFMAGR